MSTKASTERRRRHVRQCAEWGLGHPGHVSPFFLQLEYHNLPQPKRASSGVPLNTRNRLKFSLYYYGKKKNQRKTEIIAYS